eukprot:GHUV01031750.1.p1 GENE.GHUV01031750.1~~GHUV01031750.1.p1  ORF type:complete len:385 (+),score=108.45 GHUV01031750.1:933-2087(+)
MSAVEDLVQQMSPGVRILRARFGQVPAEALLDLDVPDYTDSQHQPDAPQTKGQVQGEIAFLSHEPIVSAASVRPKQRRGMAAVRRRTHGNATAGNSTGNTHQSAHHHNSFGSVSFTASEPLCMACFQTFVADELVPAQGLFRAKGFAWFQQQRSQQYVFHFSGKQRVECGTEGCWQGPPGIQIVLIGQQKDLLQQLKEGLHGCLVSECPCRCHNGQLPAAQQPDLIHGDNAREGNAASQLVQLISQHPWFEVVGSQEQLECSQQQLTKRGSTESGVVQYTAKSSVLHGVLAEEVNARVLSKMNTVPGIFICHKKSPAALQSVTGQPVGYQGVAAMLQCLHATHDVHDAMQKWQLCAQAVVPVVRKAYQHVHNCKCDMALAVASG